MSIFFHVNTNFQLKPPNPATRKLFLFTNKRYGEKKKFYSSAIALILPWLKSILFLCLFIRRLRFFLYDLLNSLVCLNRAWPWRMSVLVINFHNKNKKVHELNLFSFFWTFGWNIYLINNFLKERRLTLESFVMKHFQNQDV